MHRLLPISLLAAALGSFVPVESSAQCVLDAAAPLGRTTGTLKLTVDKIAAAPGYGPDVERRLDSGVECRLHLSPPVDATRFRFVVTPQFTGPRAGQPSELEIISVDAVPDLVRMSPIRVRSGQQATADVTIIPASRVGREYNLAVVTRDMTGSTADTVGFHLLWASEPEIRASTGRTSCGAEICLFDGQRTEVRLTGTDVGEVDPSGRVTTRFFWGGAELGPIQTRIEANSDGLLIPVVTPYSQVDSVRFQVPLQIGRVRSGKAESFVAITYPVGVETPGKRSAAFHYPNGNNLGVLRGSSAGLPVRLKAPGVILALTPNVKYPLRELVAGAQGAPVADFHVDEVAGDSATGILVPVGETRSRTGRDGAPTLVLAGNGKQVLQIPLVVLPKTSVTRVYVRRPGRPEEANGALHPADSVRLRLEGPGVGYLRGGEIAGSTVKLPQVTLHRDTIEFDLRIPASASPNEVLRLRDVDTAEVLVPLTITPNQRPRRDLRFAELQYRRGARLLPRPLPGIAQRDTFTTTTLSDVVLRVDPLSVDSTNALYGVQYLTLRADLYNAAGVRVDTVSQCVMVVPPAVEGRVYPTTGNCKRVDNGEFAISDLMPAASRATAQSRMVIRLRHDPTQYPSEDVAEVRETRITRKGWIVWEPRLQLPGAVLAWRRGRTTPGITYAGALISATPMIRQWNKSHHWSVQGGLLVGTVPSTSTGSDDIGGRLSVSGGLNYIFRNMVGDVALDFFVGRVYPISRDGLRTRDSYFVFRPGFSLGVGK